VRRDGTVKVADFGIARLTEEVSRTMTGTVMGSPLYMAPEQIEGRTPTGALDVFALGSVLFRMLAGCSPFEAEHPHAIMWRIVSEPAPPLAQTVPGIDPTLADLVERMLRKNPLERPTAADASRTLRQFLSAGGVSDPIEFVRARVLPDDIRRAPPVSVSPRLVGGTLPDAPPRPAPPSRAPKQGRRASRTILWGASVTAFLACTLLLVVLVLRPTVSSDAAPQSAAPESESFSATSPKAPAPTRNKKRHAGPRDEPSHLRPDAHPERPQPPTDRAASGSIAVTGRDEAPNEGNAIKARLAFRNTGSETIHSFRMTWDLPGEPRRKPQVDAYYAPGCNARIEPRPGGLRLEVECAGLDLRSGQIHPGPDGISLGIHYQDWSTWNRKGASGLGSNAAALPDARIDVGK